MAEGEDGPVARRVTPGVGGAEEIAARVDDEWCERTGAVLPVEGKERRDGAAARGELEQGADVGIAALARGAEEIARRVLDEPRHRRLAARAVERGEDGDHPAPLHDLEDRAVVRC